MERHDSGADVVPTNATSATPTGEEAMQLSLVVNEGEVRALGLATPEQAVGQTIKIKAWAPNLQYLIIGVTPDLPVDSIRVAFQPTVYFVDQSRLTMISARLTGHTIPEALAQINRLWQRIGEPRPIERQFLDEYYEFLYSGVTQQARLKNRLSK